MGSSDERKSHRHDRHSKHSRHKKHKSHHKHKHKHRHKKNHHKEKEGINLCGHVIEKTPKSLEDKEKANSGTLELVMTEHLLSQLEEANNESDESDSTSADENEPTSDKDPTPSDKNTPTSSKTPPRSNKGSSLDTAVVSDSKVSSTSNSGSQPAAKTLVINIQSKTLPSNYDPNENTSDSVLPVNQANKPSEDGPMTTDGDVIITYVNLKPSQTQSTSAVPGAGKDKSLPDTKTEDAGDRVEGRVRKRRSSKSPSQTSPGFNRRRKSRSHSKSRRSHSRDRKRSRSRDRKSRRSHSRNRSRRSHSKDKGRRSSYRHRSRSPRRGRRSPQRRRRSYSSRSRSLSHSRTRSRSRTKSRSKSREAEAESSVSKLQVVQEVSKIAKEFGAIKRQVEISHLTNFCSQLQVEQAVEDGGGGVVTRGSSHDYRTPFEVNPSTLSLDNLPRRPVSNQFPAGILMPPRPVEEMFPVSAGVEHAGVAESLAVGDNVFEQTRGIPVSQLMNRRLELTQRLQNNPSDYEARFSLATIEQQTSLWAQSGVKPGQFTGRKTLNPLSHEEHRTGYQTWAKKNMFHGLAPVVGGFGLKMLKKMGWTEGQPLGLSGRGNLEPLALDVKTDRSGLKSSSDNASMVNVPGSIQSRSKAPAPSSKSKSTASDIAQSKHPVSALQEICHKRHWNIPQYESSLPSDGKPFLFKVVLPVGSYVPLSGSMTKKEAKACAASAALHGLGLTAKTVEYSYSALN